MWKRPLARIGIGCFAALLLAVGGGWFWLQSNLAATLERQLSAQLRAPVKLDRAQIDWSAGQLHGLSIHEATGDHKPWFKAVRLPLAYGLSHYFAGHKAPAQLTIEQPELLLRFGPGRTLQTQFPQPAATGEPMIPLHLRDGTLTLRFADEPDRIFRGLNLTVTQRGDEIVGEGTGDDPAWGGHWTLQTRTDAAGNTALALHHPTPLHVTPALLRQVPFVNLAIWDEFEAEGDTPVNVVVRFGPNYPTTRYRVELKPANTRLRVAIIDLKADAAAGDVVVEDGVVSLTNVVGDYASGKLSLGSNLDFRGDTTQMRFDIRAQNLELNRLPEKWGVPKRINGRLAGRANLQLAIRDGTVSPTGEGTGTVVPAVKGIVLPVGLRLHIVGDGQRLRFGVD